MIALPKVTARRAVAVGGVLVVVLGLAGLITSSGDPSASATARSARTSASPSAPAVQATSSDGSRAPSGFNLHDGGQLGTDQAVVPQQAPDGRPVGGSGQQAQAAGPGNYTGYAPAELVLPSGRRAPIDRAGVRTDGTLAVPDDPAQVGWWTGGAQPGERYGGTVLAGHIDSRQYGLGVLAEMLHAKTGQRIAVLGAGGQRQTYRITGVQQVNKARLAAGTGAFAQDVLQRLVLITCGGPFDPATHHYRDNIVVIAEPVT